MPGLCAVAVTTSPTVNAASERVLMNPRTLETESDTDIVDSVLPKYPYEAGDGEKSRRSDGGLALR